MNIKQAINIFLSIFNLSIDSDAKDDSSFRTLRIVDSQGFHLGTVDKNPLKEIYSIFVSSSQIGGMTVIVTKDNGVYNLSGSINTHMLNSQNRVYDTITNKMIITTGEEIEISNVFTASKKREVVMVFSANNNTKNLNLMLKDDIVTLRDDTEKTILDVKNLNVGGVEVTGYKSDNYVLYEFEPLDKTKNSSGGFTASSDSITLENITYPFPFVTSDFTIDFDLVKKIRESSNQSPSLNYFDNIFSLLLSNSKAFDKREINAIFGYIPYELTTTPILVNGIDVLYPGDKKAAIHIGNQ